MEENPLDRRRAQRGLSRSLQSAICFALAFVGFVVVATVYPPNSTPREHWLAAFTVILLTTGTIGAGIGALLGNVWIGFLVGFLLPIVAFFVFGVGGMLC